MNLGEKLRNAVEKIRNSSSLDKETVKEAVKEIQRALISSDVEVSLVLDLSKKIEENAFKDLPEKISRREFVIKTVYDELVKVLGGEKTSTPDNPKRILLCGLYGQGKTTSAGKLGKYYSKRGKKVGLIAADTFRPAAFEQLKQLSEKANLQFFGNPKEKKAEKVVEEGIKKLKECDLIIVDSAGRSALDKELVEEIKKVNHAFKPDYTILVLSADLGQLAKKQSIAFKEAIGVNGILLTKVDGSAKGGGALTACSITRSPVYFIGTGEKLEDLQEFNAQRYLSKIMGYGDLQELLEKAKEASMEEELDPEELLKGEFSLQTFYSQLKATKKMGPLNKVMEMMGLNMQLPKEQMEMTEEKLDKFKVMMDSMTKQEKADPELLNKNRILRIANGSGTSEEEVRELLKQFKNMKNMFRKFKKLNDEKYLSKLQKKGGMEQLLKGMGKTKKKKF
ncbi:MAG: signal recognition particle receptor subunit alpha, partial [archaeon]|nr:signal recognition particle receptor subunit alpha [archaeon]